MKNIFEVIRQKEAQIQQLQKDIDALKTAARLLAEDGDEESPRPMPAQVAGTPLAAMSRPVVKDNGSTNVGWDAASKQFP